MTDQRPIAHVVRAYRRTVLPPAGPGRRPRRWPTRSPPTGRRRRALSPRSPPACPRFLDGLGGARRRRARRRSSATRPTASATTADSTRCAPTAGGGRGTCGGRSRPTVASSAPSPGSARWPTAIGEHDEAERIALVPRPARPRRAATRAVTRRGASLCGGASRRMGTDKALVEVDGVAMAERVARALDGRRGARSCAFIGGDVAAAGGARASRRAPTAGPGAGRLGGVLTALERQSTPSVVVAACDLPDLDADTHRRRLVARRASAAAGSPSPTAPNRCSPGGHAAVLGAVAAAVRPPANAAAAPSCSGRSATSPSRSPPAGCATSTPRPTCRVEVRPPAAARRSVT